MLRNYVVAAYRNLIKNPLYAAINIVGLGIGLAACLLILLYVRGEFSFENWIPDANRIFVVQTRFDVPGRAPLLSGQSPGLAAESLGREFDEIEAVTRLHPRRPRVRRGNKLFFNRLYLVDENFFELIAVPFVAGDPKTALQDNSSIVLTESMVEKYFGDEPALGKTLAIDDNVRDRDFKITGIIKDTPKNSDFRFELIGRFDANEFRDVPWVADQWTSVNVYTYVKLRKGAEIDAVRAKMPEFEARVVPDADFGGRSYSIAEFIDLTFMPILDSHLRTLEGSQTSAVSRYASVMTFAAVALLILFIACINFMNLSTARASLRAREVSLRKVMGATRRELIGQFLGESVLLALLGLALALAAVELVLPSYNGLLDRELELHMFGQESIVPWLGVLVVLVGIVGGLYPAVYLSRFEPARILKANKSSDSGGTAELRGFLVILQFAISIALIISTTVIYRQYEFSQNKDLGFNKNNMLLVRGLSRKDAARVSAAFKNEVAKIPGVLAVTRSSDVPGDSNESNSPVEPLDAGASEPIVLGRLYIDDDFIDSYEIEVLAGRDLDDRARDDGTGIDIANGGDGLDFAPSVLLNENAVQMLGFESPDDAIGKTIRVSYSEDYRSPALVVGVVR
ncbi:MAG: ABC transporter permease, partial [Myxococcota bacterium]